MTGIILTTNVKELFKEKYFPNSFVHKINGRKFYVIKSLTDEMFVISICNMNEFDVASCATHMITNFNLSSIIHIGIGSTDNNSVNDYDILLVDTVIDFKNKIEYTLDGFEIVKSKIKFETSLDFNEVIRNVLSIANYDYSFGQSTLIFNKNIADLFNKNMPTIYDLESVPIANICDHYKIMWSIVKIKVNNQKKLNESIQIIEKLIYNIVQLISYEKLKRNDEKNVI